MKCKNPIRLYFWEHGPVNGANMDELDTPTLRNSVRDSDVVYLEFGSEDISATREIEHRINNHSRYGTQSIFDPNYTITPRFYEMMSLLMELTKGTDKRYIFEKTVGGLDYDAREAELTKDFFEDDLEEAAAGYEFFLYDTEPWHMGRELRIAEDLLDIQASITAILGLGHLDIRDLLSPSRYTEALFPFRGYPEYNPVKLKRRFRRTGEVDWELFLKK